MSRALDTLFADLPARLDVEQVTNVLGLSDKTVTYRWLREGRIPAIRLGGSWIILRDDVKDHLEKNYNTQPEFVDTPPPATDQDETPSTSTVRADENQNVLPVHAEKAPRKSSKRAATTPEERQRIRQWAKDNGHTVRPQGAISRSIVDAYDQAHL